MADAAAQAETFKAQGNDFLKAKKFSEAIEAYSKVRRRRPPARADRGRAAPRARATRQTGATRVVPARAPPRPR